MTDKEILLVCAARYAIGRQTYMPSTVADIIRAEITDISDFALKTIREDIEFAVKNNLAGDERIDVPVWKNLHEFITQEEKRREEQC